MGYRKEKTELKSMSRHHSFCAMSIFRTPLFGTFSKNNSQLKTLKQKAHIYR